MVLTWRHQQWTGPEDLPTPPAPEVSVATQRQRVIAQAERITKGIPEKYAPGVATETRYAAPLDESVLALTQKNFGVTIDLGGHRPPVGTPTHTEKDTEFSIEASKFRLHHIDDFIDKHAEELAQEGNNLGTWVDEGRVYIDISRVGAVSADTIEEAQKAEQLGIFDLEHHDTIDIGKIENGKYTPLGSPSDLHDQYQRQIAEAAEKGSAGSVSEVSVQKQIAGDRGQPPG